MLLVGLAVLATGRGSLASTKDSTTLKPAVEAWYQQVPPCLSLVDRSALPGATVYPENTLHVEISAGQERGLLIRIPASLGC